MLMLISLEQAKTHLRVDNSAEDGDIELKVKAATKMIERYLGQEKFFSVVEVDSSGEIVLDSAGEPMGVPEDLQAACSLLTGLLYSDRDGRDYIEGKVNSSFERTGSLVFPRAVHAILDTYKKPILA